MGRKKGGGTVQASRANSSHFQIWLHNSLAEKVSGIAERERRTNLSVLEIMVEFAFLRVTQEGLNLSQVCTILEEEGPVKKGE